MSRSPYRRTPWGRIIVAGVAVAVAGIYGGLALRVVQEHRSAPPPPDGYFALQPVGSYARLPDDAAAAVQVHHSAWEVRAGNARYNNAMPVQLKLQRVSDATHAYDRDFVNNRAQCPAGYLKLPCPVTFGIVGTKSTNLPGLFPWNRDSTAVAVDVLGGWLRGCYEGWVRWLSTHGNRSHGVYHAGDIWGCVGAWYSGDWLDGTAAKKSGERYISQAGYWDGRRPWLLPGF